eukprot:4130123-Pleurochrysis_carterae.AAC.3
MANSTSMRSAVSLSLYRRHGCCNWSWHSAAFGNDKQICSLFMRHHALLALSKLSALAPSILQRFRQIRVVHRPKGYGACSPGLPGWLCEWFSPRPSPGCNLGVRRLF